MLAALKNSQTGRKFNKKFPGPTPRDLDTPGLYRGSDIGFFSSFKFPGDFNVQPWLRTPDLWQVRKQRSKKIKVQPQVA